jgi:hypothetical protein
MVSGSDPVQPRQSPEQHKRALQTTRPRSAPTTLRQQPHERRSRANSPSTARAAQRRRHKNIRITHYECVLLRRLGARQVHSCTSGRTSCSSNATVRLCLRPQRRPRLRSAPAVCAGPRCALDVARDRPSPQPRHSEQRIAYALSASSRTVGCPLADPVRPSTRMVPHDVRWSWQVRPECNGGEPRAGR